MSRQGFHSFTINELERAVTEAADDPDVLATLHDEVENRAPDRLSKLRDQLSDRLSQSNDDDTANTNTKRANANAGSIEANNRTTDFERVNWHQLLEKDIDSQKPRNAPKGLKKGARAQAVAAIDTWIATEALSPSSYDKVSALKPKNADIFDLTDDHLHWNAASKPGSGRSPFYVVYLGSIALKDATEDLIKLYGDPRRERPRANKNAAVGVLILDKSGCPIDGKSLTVSSFPWAYGQALASDIENLKYWPQAERFLARNLHQILIKHGKDGSPLPVTKEQLIEGWRWVLSACNIPPGRSLSPSFAIVHHKTETQGPPDPPLLNSYLIEDLFWTRTLVAQERDGKALKQYLSPLSQDQQLDLMEHKEYIEAALEPDKMPAGRWPGPGGHALYLMQQTSVNLARHDLREAGLFSVNGPPGTGKTTLLRDIIAATIVDHAAAFSEFDDPEDAFTHQGKIKHGNSFTHLYKLAGSLKGFETLVASSNNSALKNITHALPQSSQIDCHYSVPSYFKPTTEKLLGGNTDCWGLVSAALGKATNRKVFRETVWWDRAVGLSRYLWSINDHDGKKSGPSDAEKGLAATFEGEQPPKTRKIALANWAAAREDFLKEFSALERDQRTAQNALQAQKLSLQLNQECSESARRLRGVEAEKSQETALQQALSLDIESLREDLHLLEVQEKSMSKRRPGFIARLFASKAWRSWQKDQIALLHEFRTARQDLKGKKSALSQSATTLRDLQPMFDAAKKAASLAQRNKSKADAKILISRSITEDQLVTSDLWKESHKDQQTHLPTYSKETHKKRDKLFLAAMRLRRAFIDAAARPLRHNLKAYFYSQNGTPLPDDHEDLLPDLWSCLFLITPVVSTTFASAAVMLKDLPAESLGWLLVDEAGQALPQAALGVLARSRRAIFVGDPLQLKPIVTLPTTLIDTIAGHFGVDKDLWVAPSSTAQCVADRASRYGTTVVNRDGEKWIGAPLMVHRRCAKLMFDMSNELAYGGMMVHAAEAQDRRFEELFGKSSWIDVQMPLNGTSAAGNKWSAAEGAVVNWLVEEALTKLDNPDIFIITPFRDVVQGLKTLLFNNPRIKTFANPNYEKWFEKRVGTVHTFQGNEAATVILLLGAPLKTSIKAREWATKEVNLLNVAVSRAKGAFYVVGNHAHWAGTGNMQVISDRLETRTSYQFMNSMESAAGDSVA